MKTLLNSEITQIELNIMDLTYRLFICIAGNTTKLPIEHDHALELINSVNNSNAYKININTQSSTGFIYYEVQSI